MSRIEDAFKEKAFVAFITGGDPDMETSEKLILAMAEAGADVIEIGIPFSDPIAEGPVIQAADERALLAGCTTDKLFDMVKRLREKTQVPLLFMTYLNPVYTYGKEPFLKGCRECSLDGIIVPDMPFEEKGELEELCRTYGVDLISMVSPTSDDRIAMIAKEAKGFVYCVSSLGVTGVRSELGGNIGEMINKVRSATSVPCAIGFGISTPEQAGRMASLADGVIVGSAIVKIVEQYGGDAVKPVSDYIREMKAAIRHLENKDDESVNGGNQHV